MNQVKARSRKEVMSCAALTSGSVIFFAFHIASHKNQNYYGSSNPMPLNMGSLMSSTRWAMGVLGGLGGGQDVDRGGVYRGRLTCGRNTRTWSDCDRISEVTWLRGRVTGGFPTKGFSSESNSSGLTGEDAVA